MLSSLGNEIYQDVFDSFKSLVCPDTTLCYFDICRPVIIQIDASKKGLGVALLQDGCPVAFASKALTPTDQCYVNIEHQLLACIFGAEQFCTYVFDCEFTRQWPQTPWADYAQETGRCTSPHSSKCCYASRTMTFASNTDPGERCS